MNPRQTETSKEEQKNDSKWEWGKELEPSPLLVQSILAKPRQPVVKFPIQNFESTPTFKK